MASLSLEAPTACHLLLKLWWRRNLHFNKVILMFAIISFSLCSSGLVRAIMLLILGLRFIKLMLRRIRIVDDRMRLSLIQTPRRRSLLILSGQFVHSLARFGSLWLTFRVDFKRLCVPLSLNFIVLRSDLAPVHRRILLT